VAAWPQSGFFVRPNCFWHRLLFAAAVLPVSYFGKFCFSSARNPAVRFGRPDTSGGELSEAGAGAAARYRRVVSRQTCACHQDQAGTLAMPLMPGLTGMNYRPSVKKVIFSSCFC